MPSPSACPPEDDVVVVVADGSDTGHCPLWSEAGLHKGTRVEHAQETVNEHLKQTQTKSAETKRGGAFQGASSWSCPNPRLKYDRFVHSLIGPATVCPVDLAVKKKTGILTRILMDGQKENAERLVQNYYVSDTSLQSVTSFTL